MGKWVLAGVGVLVTAMVVAQWPEIQRYRRIESM